MSARTSALSRALPRTRLSELAVCLMAYADVSLPYALCLISCTKEPDEREDFRFENTLDVSLPYALCLMSYAMY